MADPAVSSAQRELGDKILSALNILKMPITSHEWKHQPRVAQYQLIINAGLLISLLFCRSEKKHSYTH
jgi:hypothetical protein